VVGDEVAVLATATTGGSNVVRCGETAARKELQAAMEKACTAAKVRLAEVARICVGVAGAGRPAINSIVSSAIAEVYKGEVQVDGDMVIALEAAFAGNPGVIVIAGTGSIAYGRNAEGRTSRAGGWGFAISDEGSGHWIGQAAVSAVMHEFDENEAAPAALYQNILRAWNLNSLDELIRKANSPAANFSTLCPHILAAAEAGDPIAHTLVTQAGSELARLANTVIGRLGLHPDPVPVAMSGGVFRNSA
jgi:N-acetylglucosamine kinase-like BadF-type ATPase